MHETASMGRTIYVGNLLLWQAQDIINITYIPAATPLDIHICTYELYNYDRGEIQSNNMNQSHMQRKSIHH